MAKQSTVMLRMLGDNTDLRKRLADSERRLRRFENQAKRTGRGAAGMNRGFGSAGKGLKGMIGPAAGAGAALLTLNGAMDFAKQSVGAYQDLAKASMGLARTTGMDVETASAWVSVTKQRGIGAQKLTTSFNTLARRVDSVKTGSKSSIDAFDRLGVSMASLDRGDTSAILAQVSDGFAGMKDGPEKTALALKLFGRQGQAMLPILNKGSGALKEQLAEMKALGATVGGKGADDVASYAANQRTLKTAIEGVKVSLGAALVPALAKASTSLVRWVKQAREGKGTAGALKAVVIAVAGGLREFVRGIAPAVRWLGRFAAEHPGIVKFVVVGAILGKLGMNFIGLARRIGPVIGVLARVGKALFAFMKILRLAPLMAGPFGILIAAIVTGAILIVTHWGTVKKWLGAVWGWMVGTFKRVAGTVAALARRGFLGPIPLIVSRWRQIKDFLGRVWGAIRGFFSAGAERIKALVRNGFVNPASWIRTKWNSIVGFLRGLPDRVSTIAKRVGSKMWGGIRNGAGAIGGFVKGILNGMIGGLETGVNTIIRGLNAAIKQINKIPGVDIPRFAEVTLPRLADGGFISKATVAMVGEAGPEAVIPLSRSRRRRGLDLFGATAAALGIAPSEQGPTRGPIKVTVNNYGERVDENVLAARLAWQLQSRGI